ncbi:hypothetical protein LX99_02206 [Mucilaginibacter oryzae]|uniref:Uncharacterized protein n=1 Tax=Mucilaginibacter oryzae TaxID=468058 RepID=A0A316HTR5_9SPHI|nr:hypothetical protein LX99_02206 [Mucilaginibacter oryzae]
MWRMCKCAHVRISDVQMWGFQINGQIINSLSTSDGEISSTGAKLPACRASKLFRYVPYDKPLPGSNATSTSAHLNSAHLKSAHLKSAHQKNQLFTTRCISSSFIKASTGVKVFTSRLFSVSRILTSTGSSIENICICTACF